MLSHVKKVTIAGTPTMVFNQEAMEMTNIGFVGEYAKSLVEGYTDKDVPGVVANVAEFSKGATLAAALCEQGSRDFYELRLGHVLTMAMEQCAGDKGDLLVNGRPNVFCVLLGVTPVAFTLRFNTAKQPSHWDLAAYSIGNTQKYRKGDRVFYRAL